MDKFERLMVFIIIILAIIAIYIWYFAPCNNWFFRNSSINEVPTRCLNIMKE